MNHNIPDDSLPFYNPIVPMFRGMAVGGPRDGDILTSSTLTHFIERRVKNRSIDYNGRTMAALTAEEVQELAAQDKAAMKEKEWAKQNPHRYDFDFSSQTWIYVEYPTTNPL